MHDLRCMAVVEAIQGSPIKIVNRNKGYAVIGIYGKKEVTYYESPSLVECGWLAWKMGN